MNSLMIGGAAAALALAITPAFAQVPPPPGVAPGTTPTAPLTPPMPRTQTRVMIMSSGTMTRDQLAAHVREFFGRLDLNHDGYLTRDEVGSMGQHAMMIGQGPGMVGHMGKQMADGMAMPDRGAVFDRLDANHDGNISRQEFMASKPQIRTERFVLKREGGPEAAAVPGMPAMAMRMHGGMGMGKRAGMGMGMGGHLFEMADANHDGRVSLAEAQAAVLAHFDKADVNRDGKISPEERQQIHAMMRERRPS